MLDESVKGATLEMLLNACEDIDHKLDNLHVSRGAQVEIHFSYYVLNET